MALVHLLPSPSHLLRTLVSALNSTTSPLYYRHAIDIRRPPHDFDVDHDTGFVPARPIGRLSGAYSLWEEALNEASEVLSLGEDESDEAVEKRKGGAHWRTKVASWPVLDITEILNDNRALQRAHHVLAFLTHYFVHSIPPSDDDTPVHVPQSLAVPLVEVSKRLDIAPVLTYADTVLWNWELIDPTRPISIDNVQLCHTFSGTDDERSFYIVSLEVELRAVELLQIVDDYNNLPRNTDSTAIAVAARYLTRIKSIIEDFNTIVQSVRPICDPHVFYWDIRPWFEGTDAKGPGSLGWVFDGVPNSHLLQLSGPSGGQSSSMHLMDVFLDIDHKLQKKRYPPPSQNDVKVSGFMERMRLYMPGKHREYLVHLEQSQRSIRDLAQRIPALQEPYDAAVRAAQRMRDMHMRIACLYIVSMSKSLPGTKSGCPASAMLDRIEASRRAGNGPVRGTGGNALSMLLKAGRDTTKRALLKN